MAKHGPDTPSLAHERQSQAATICRDLYAGPLAIRAQGRTYLPQFPAETDDAYDFRLGTSVCYDAFARTIDGLTGMVMRKPPKLADELPQQITDLWENIDNLGTHGDVFVHHRHRDGEIDGHFVIFVDMPPADPNIRTLRDERMRRARPYWIGIKKQDVLAAHFSDVGGRSVLTHFRYRETITVRDGYAERPVERIREYNLDGSQVAFIIWEQGEKEDWVAVASGTMDIDEIPVAVGYHGQKLGEFESRPPHIALALESIKHYQLTSDNDNVLHKTCVPILTRIGYENPDEGHTISPSVGLDLPMGGDAKFISPPADGFDAVERRIEKSEHRLAVLGMSALMGVKARPETATGERIEKAETDSALASHARATQDAIEEAVRLTAKWLGIEEQLPERSPESRWVALNRDFEALTLDAQMVTAIANVVTERHLSPETLWDILQRASILTDDFDPETEKDRIEATGAQGLNEIARILRQRRQEPDEQDKAA